MLRQIICILHSGARARTSDAVCRKCAADDTSKHVTISNAQNFRKRAGMSAAVLAIFTSTRGDQRPVAKEAASVGQSSAGSIMRLESVAATWPGRGLRNRGRAPPANPHQGEPENHNGPRPGRGDDRDLYRVVLADSECSSKERDTLRAPERHVHGWRERSAAGNHCRRHNLEPSYPWRID